MLLVLDNLEQVLGAAPLITQLLGAAGGLTVLATSREILNLSGEHVVTVPPLQTGGVTKPVKVVTRTEAVQLFLDRARAVRADVPLDVPQLQAVAEICRRLEGLPLAIELAAARERLLDPVELLDRLDSRFAVLTGGPRDLPERQRTLRRTVEWSYDLLGAETRWSSPGWPSSSAASRCPPPRRCAPTSRCPTCSARWPRWWTRA